LSVTAGSNPSNAVGVADALAELQKVRYLYLVTEKELRVLKVKLAEVGEARRVLSKGVHRRIYRALGNLLIEVSEEEARKYLEEEEEVLKLRVNALEKRRRELLSKIAELEKGLGIR